ncbi:MAG TPA: hypothetical protein VLA34_00345, partial [Candidatus Krumholzibacterium sp.]|nr:hypothetical protein [Candidatus Krumholzibacterium sp.]
MKRYLMTILTLALLGGSADAAERLVVFRFHGTGVGEETVDAAGIIFRGALSKEGRYQPVSSFDVLGDVDCAMFDCAVALAREAGIRYAVTGHITRLGEKIIADVELVDAADGAVVIAEDGVALSEGDLDVVLKRLAKSVSTGRPLDGTAELGMVTESEAAGDRRRSSFTTKGFRLGFMWPTSESMGIVDRLAVIDFVIQHEVRDFFLSGRTGVRFGGGLDSDGTDALDFALLDTKIGYYFSREDFSPFFSTGIGIHWVKIRQNSMDEDRIFDHRDDGMGMSFMVGM